MAKTKRRKGSGRSRKRKGRGPRAARPAARQSPQLSLCMIARDEATFLDRCLRSVRGLADEVVVVDTGSTDDTIAVARRHGACVHSVPWRDDFSEARNHALEQARGRWILVLDCDEQLAPRDHEAVRAAVATPGVDAFRLTTRNYTDQSDRVGWTACDGSYAEQEAASGWFPTTKVRLWRNHPQVRFRGAVHELVEGSLLDQKAVLADCPVAVHHDGLVAKDRPVDRYLETGRRKVAAAPDDLRARYELAVALRDAGQLDEALRQIVAVVDGLAAGAGSDDRRLYLQEEDVLLVRADVLDRMGRLEEALAAYEAIPDRFPGSFQAHNNAGSLLGRLGRVEAARQAYLRALQMAPENPVVAQNLERLERQAGAPPPPDPGAAPHSLSLCVIVRDGARDLERCLSSAAGVADEIVVVDTGSSDDSVAVAQRFGARVGRFEWCDDFAAARNRSLELASGDWILWLDADDHLLPEDQQRVRQAKALAPAEALSFTLVNTGGADTSRFRQIKMFPNRPDIRFERPVHETVLPALRRLGVPVRTTDARVMHTGYADAQQVARKTAYYERLMADWLRAHPDDLDICFRLGHTAYARGDRERATARFEQVLAAGEAAVGSLRRHAYLFRGRCRLESGDWRAAIPDFESALRLDPKDVFANASLGDALTKAGDFERAVEHLRRSLEHPLDGTFPLDGALVEYGARFFLGEALAALGRLDEAVEALEAAAEVAPERSEARQALRQLQPSAAARPRGSVRHSGPPEAVDPGARLSLCMIVRDEVQRLGRCLESARAVVDEIVVVDTGSTDGTVDVARRFDATIGHFEWCDDFSAARNEALRLATGDWILWLDADDLLPAECHDAVRRLVAGPRDCGYFFVLDDRGYESVSCLQLRLFPNVDGVRFEMPVHEQVTPSLASLGIDMVPTDVRVVHTGYTTPAVVAAKKARYLGIMERWLESHPQDYIVRSHVALTCHTTGRLQEAAEHYRRIIEDSDCRRDHNYVILTTAMLFLGRTHQKLGDLEEAWSWLKKAEEVDDDYVLTQFSLAEVALDRGQADEAVAYARPVLERDTAQLTFFPIDQTELKYSTLCVLGRALARLGRLQEADTALRQAAGVPVARRSDALGSLSEIYRDAGDDDAATEALDQALRIEPDSPRHLFNLGMLHLAADRLDAAEDRFRRVVDVVGEAGDPAAARALLNLGFLAKKRGDMAAAEARYRQVLAADPDHVDAAANLGHLLLGLERHAEAARWLEAVRLRQPGLLDIDLGLLLARLAAGAWDAALAREVFERFPEVAAAVPARPRPEEAGGPLVQLGAALLRSELTRCAEMAFAAAVACGGAAVVPARRCLGEMHLAGGRYWQAIAEFEALLRENPADGEAFRRLGDCYARLGVDDAAQLCYQRSAGLGGA